MWPTITLCLAVCCHLFVVGNIKRFLLTPFYPIYTSCNIIMSSSRKATTPAARRNPSRAAKAPRATTGAPQRVRTSPHGDQTGGSQADPHEAAELSDEGSSDGDTSGAEHGQHAGSEAALGGRSTE